MQLKAGDLVYLLSRAGRVEGVFASLRAAQAAGPVGATWTSADPNRWVTTDGEWVVAARLVQGGRA
jgi:hypothetical protein